MLTPKGTVSFSNDPTDDDNNEVWADGDNQISCQLKDTKKASSGQTIRSVKLTKGAGVLHLRELQVLPPIRVV